MSTWLAHPSPERWRSIHPRLACAAGCMASLVRSSAAWPCTSARRYCRSCPRCWPACAPGWTWMPTRWPSTRCWAHAFPAWMACAFPARWTASRWPCAPAWAGRARGRRAVPGPELRKLFPSAQTLAAVNASELGALGVVRQRQQALIALAQAVCQGQLDLTPGAQVARTLAQLQALPGIGPWTAQYIAMRALRWPDALPAKDVALQHALGVRHEPAPARAVEKAFAAWAPWRSYAVIRAWHAPNPTGAHTP